MSQGIFSLTEVRTEQLKNISFNNFSYWAESSICGYFGGGRGGANTNTSDIDRLEFSTETVSQPNSNLSSAKYSMGATSSGSYGYFGGGDSPVPSIISTIERLDLSNETTTIPTSTLSSTRRSLAATSSGSYGYFCGGTTPASVSTINRLDFSTETVTVPTSTLPLARFNLTAVSSSSYGYFGGGYIGGLIVISSMDRLDFSTETAISPSFVLSMGRAGYSATSSNSYGYFCGGRSTSPLIQLSSINRIDFSTETPSSTINLSGEKRNSTAVSSSSYGYIAGGNTQPVPSGSPPTLTTIDRLDFSTEIITSSLNLFFQNSYAGAISGGQSVVRGGNKTYGYFFGGAPSTSQHVEFLNFQTETTSTLEFNYSPRSTGPVFNFESKYRHAASSSSYYAWFGGGDTNFVPVAYSSSLKRLDFSSNLIATPISTLSSTKNNLAATSSSSYGYFGGGETSSLNFTSIIDRLDFSTEIITVPTSKLSSAKSRAAATKNLTNSYGYFGGGDVPPVSPPSSNSNGFRVSTIDRLDFSTETVTTLAPKLSTSKRSLSATSSSSYGYFGGGYARNSSPNFISTIDRLDFSTETISSKSALNLSEGRAAAATVSNDFYGYFGGGYTSPLGSRTSVIDRLDFSIEIMTTPTSILTQARTSAAGASNSN
jgi:hypothetical protein